MDYIDFHTHHPSRQGETVIQDGVHTWGIHPWKASLPHAFPSSADHLMAIGECGLDVYAQASMEQQMQVFVGQLRLAQEWHLPVILHCVKCLDSLLALHKEMKPAEPWILHGFRGKPRQLESLLKAGFHVSFGFRFHPAPLSHAPASAGDRRRPKAREHALSGGGAAERHRSGGADRCHARAVPYALCEKRLQPES